MAWRIPDATKIPPSRRVRIEVALGVASAVLLALTMAWPDWIERFFGLAPDAGDGSAEWGLALAFGVAALVFFADAGRMWRRRARASAASK
jgi:hypothetical protein